MKPIFEAQFTDDTEPSGLKAWLDVMLEMAKNAGCKSACCTQHPDIKNLYLYEGFSDINGGAGTEPEFGLIAEPHP